MICSTARYLLRSLGVVQVQIDGGKINARSKRNDRMKEEDKKSNKANEPEKTRSGSEPLTFFFVAAVHIFSIASSKEFLPDRAGDVYGQKAHILRRNADQDFALPGDFDQDQVMARPERVFGQDFHHGLRGRPFRPISPSPEHVEKAKKNPRTSARAPAVFNNSNPDSIGRTFSARRPPALRLLT